MQTAREIHKQGMIFNAGFSRPTTNDGKEIVPVCSYCQRIKDRWNEYSDAFLVSLGEHQVPSHGICPVCMAKHHPEIAG